MSVLERQAEFSVSDLYRKHRKIAKRCPEYISSDVEVSSCSYQKTVLSFVRIENFKIRFFLALSQFQFFCFITLFFLKFHCYLSFRVLVLFVLSQFEFCHNMSFEFYHNLSFCVM